MRLLYRLFLFAVLIAGSVAPAAMAWAETQTVQQLLPRLVGASYDEKSEIIDAMAATGDAKAIALLTALKNGKLFAGADGVVALASGEEGSETFANALTGAAMPVANDDNMDKIRINNRVRRQIDGAIARMTLSSPDPKKRLSAAESAYDIHDPEALPAIEEALAKEKDSSVRKHLEQARAAILLSSSDVDDARKIAAIQALEERGSQDTRNLISQMTEDPSKPVRIAATSALKSLKTSLEMWAAAQNLWYGLSLGSVLLLAAIGLSITFGVMGIINMAHGEMVMLGAYTTFMVQQACLRWAPGLLELSLVIAVPAAFLVSGAMGVLMERTIIRYLYNRPLETLLATWGVSLVLQQTVRSLFGPTNQAVISPSWMSDAFRLGQLTITYNRLWIIVFSLVVLFALMSLLKRTSFGLQTRAVTQNRRMAAAMGIRTQWIDAMTFGLGSGVAGIAGVALSQIDNVSPNLGQSYIIDSFMVVVFGGVGNLWGTLVGAMSLGVVNKILEPYVGPVLGKILVLVLIILFIQRRPRGLFALKGRAIDA